MRVNPVLVAVLLSIMLPACVAHAALRSPQVPVNGSALQSFFTSQAQSINVSAGQQDIQSFSLPVDGSFEVHSFVPTTASFGMYNAGDPAPAWYSLLPGSTDPSWFVEVGFRSAPDRAVINLFDGQGALVGTNTYLGADHANFGFVTQGADGVFYSQDARNPGGAPKILVFAGTGARAGSTWIACETSAGASGDFADVITLVNFPVLPVPTLSTTWGRVKALYK
jgi:hypothetical protein